MKKRDLLGYGAATVADSGPYNFATVYLILFLRSVYKELHADRETGC